MIYVPETSPMLGSPLLTQHSGRSAFLEKQPNLGVSSLGTLDRTS